MSHYVDELNLLYKALPLFPKNLQQQVEPFVIDPVVRYQRTKMPPKARFAAAHQFMSDVGMMMTAIDMVDGYKPTIVVCMWEALQDKVNLYFVAGIMEGMVPVEHPTVFEYSQSMTDAHLRSKGLHLVNHLLHFMSQYAVQISSAPIVKEQQRQIKKDSGQRPKEYNIIHLRRSLSQDDDLKETVRSGQRLKNQHVVRSHWQRYHTNDGVVWKKRARHLRGPDGTKITEKKRIFKVDR